MLQVFLNWSFKKDTGNFSVLLFFVPLRYIKSWSGLDWVLVSIDVVWTATLPDGTRGQRHIRDVKRVRWLAAVVDGQSCRNLAPTVGQTDIRTDSWITGGLCEQEQEVCIETGLIVFRITWPPHWQALVLLVSLLRQQTLCSAGYTFQKIPLHAVKVPHVPASQTPD